MKKYKQYTIFDNTYYILTIDLPEYKYFFIEGYILEDVERNRKSIKLKEYIGNGTIQDAVDLKEIFIDLDVDKSLNNQLIDYFFYELNLSVYDWKTYFGSRTKRLNISSVMGFDHFSNEVSKIKDKCDLLNDFFNNERILYHYSNSIRIYLKKQGELGIENTGYLVGDTELIKYANERYKQIIRN